MLKIIINGFKTKLRSNLGKDIGLTFIAQFIVMGLALVINKLLSNMLGVDGYGQYSIIKKSAAVLSFVMLSGMGIALPRYLSTYITQKDNKRAKSTILSSILVVFLISVIIIVVYIWFKDILSKLIIGSNNNQLYFSTIFYSFSLTLSSFLFAYFRGSGSFIRFSVSQIAIQLIITICTFFFGTNLFLVLNLWAVSILGYVIVSLILEKRRNTLFKSNPVSWIHNVFPQFKILLGYGLPRLAGDFFLFSFAAFPLIFINQKINVESASFFAVGIMLVSIVTPFFSFSGMVLLPYVSSSLAQKNFLQADKLISKFSILYVILSLFAMFILWLGMDVFIKLFFSSEFLPAVKVSKIIIVTILSESIYLLLRNPIDAISKTPYNTFNLFISFLVLITLFYFSKTIEHFAFSFLAASILKAFLTFISWRLCRKNALI